MTSYTYKGPVDTSVQPDLSKLKGKSAIVTGGAIGIGKAYVEALIKVGVYVTVGDVNEEKGKALVENVENAQFIKCDVRSWDDQLKMFKAAEANSPNKSVDIVVANAGIGVKDDMMFKMDDPESEPNKPDLPVLDVNLYGVLYTTKLAFHYFQKNPDDDKHDRCLVLQASLAGYLSLPGGLQYQATKYALRGMMMNTRVNFALPHYRGNAISPWFVETDQLGPTLSKALKTTGVKPATVEDCARALLFIAADKNIHGRSFAILPREKAKEGFIDCDVDDYKKGTVMNDLVEEIALAAFGCSTA